MRILSLDLSKLQVKEVGSLAAFVIKRLMVLLTGKHVPQKMVDNILDANKDFDRAVGSNVNPEQTKVLHLKDDVCDSSLQELKGLAIAATVRRDENVRSAGERVLTAIRHRGYNMQEFRIPVQVDTMRQLLADIKESPSLTADIATIGATDVVVRMEPEVNDLGNFVESIQDVNGADNLSSVEATRRLRSSMSQVFQYLNSVSDYEPEVAAAIEQINGAIEPFAVTIKSRATIRENEKKEAEGK
ncbi:DUF6261 family protein [Acetobacteroides hydrogenigenes]|uniref:Uncharacterized protein n=1 Tax=Acetobacteroides hydrogenigenes TaxID=979970 RepID=A0A4R2EN37_9BACT|nr:DUF6261 family protein [Acetobacteroides hydrogenigenes]TCN70131.1 hypothetical protein CLV25_10486 [Acetobacteroides hydrogenigenes]